MGGRWGARLVLYWVKVKVGRGSGWAGGGGLVKTIKKTSNLSPCPVPLARQTECKMSAAGQKGDRHLSKQNLVRSGEMNSKAYGSRGLQTRPHTE